MPNYPTRPSSAPACTEFLLTACFGLLLLGCDGGPTGPLLAPNELCTPATGGSVATFSDRALEQQVMSAAGVGSADELTCAVVAKITSLEANGANITALNGLQNLTGMTELLLAANRLTDIGVIGELPGLDALDIRENFISDISPLAGLSKLTALSLGTNTIRDITALTGLTRLTLLGLSRNRIQDLSPLAGLTNLDRLILLNNDISDVTALSTLSTATLLDLGENAIRDIAALSGLASLKALDISRNEITDVTSLGGLANLELVILDDNVDLMTVQPLVTNPGIDDGDTVTLYGTNVDCADVVSLLAKGVTVLSDC